MTGQAAPATYTRAQAIADGMLVDATTLAAEAGFKTAVALTCAAWNDCVAWSTEDNARKGAYQDEVGRLWDVLWMAGWAARRNPGVDYLLFRLCRVPVAGLDVEAQEVVLAMTIGHGDDGEPVVAIMQIDES